MGLAILRGPALTMNLGRSFLAVAAGIAVFMPFIASRAIADSGQPNADKKLVELQKQVSATCAVAANKSNGRCDSLMATLLEYQKQMSREARQGRQLSRADEELRLKAEEQRLVLDQQNITVGKEEAADRRNAVDGNSPIDAVESPCRSAPNPCPKPCAGEPCR